MILGMASPNRHPLNRRMRAARILAGYDASTDLASELGYKSRSTVEKIEAGTQSPTGHQLAAWARACGLPTEWFFADFDVLKPADPPVDPLELLDDLDRRIRELTGVNR